MAKGKRTGAGHKQRYTSYKANNTFANNRRKKLERALKRNPENEQIKTALKSIVYRRSTPTVREWSATKRRIATLFKEFTGVFNKEVFSNNEKLAAAAALTTRGPFSKPQPSNFKQSSMFSLATRIGV